MTQSESLTTLFSRHAVALIACLISAPLLASEADAGNCRRFYDRVDQVVVRADVRDAQETPLKGFPYLRSDRFIASLVQEADTLERFNFLRDRMMELDRRARSLELRNLPNSAMAELEQIRSELFASQSDVSAALDACAQKLLSADASKLEAIKKQIGAPTRYSLFKRLIGFYPLTAIPLARGIRKFQAEMTQTYAKNLSAVIDQRITHFYAPQAAAPVDVATILNSASNNPFNIPLPNAQQLAQLFSQFAPIFAIDTNADFDQPGAVTSGNDGKILIDRGSPKIYTLASHTMLEGQTLLQLNYMIWFSERPKKGSFDMLGGALDGLIWRVTLAQNGEPLLYDTIHPCGCYHLFFPTQKLRAKPPHPSLQEHAFIAQAAPTLRQNERPTLWIESATHYLVRVTNDLPSAVAHYDFADYDQLRSLEKPDGTRRSLFQPDGLIAGTQRGERFLFWPMGIASAGAMRQWGHHATAFVGARHFDDPDLIEKAFELAK